MSLGPVVVASGAAALAAATYIDGRLQVSKDLRTLRRMKWFEQQVAKSVKFHRESSFYLFDDSANEFPTTRAIWSRQGNYTWAQTQQWAYHYGAYFLSKGVKPGEQVAFYLINSPEMVFAWLGLWSIGCAPALVNYNLVGGSLEHCIKLAGANMILVDEDAECMARIEGDRLRMEAQGIEIVVLDAVVQSSIASLPATRPDDSLRDGVKLNSPAMLIFTSGTTGLPKAFPFVHSRNLIAGLGGRINFDASAGPTGDIMYDCMPYYHGTGGVIAMTTMMAGVTLAIGRKFSVSNFWQEVYDSNATMFIYVGETARYLLASAPSHLDRKHRVRCMHGNGLRPDVWTRFQERFNVPEVAEFFGSTEGVLHLTNYARNKEFANAVGHHGFVQRLFWRTIIAPVQVDIATGDIFRDPKTGFAKRVPYTKGGEILVKVPGKEVWPGYWRSKAASDKKFVQDVFQEGDLYYRSGDAMRRDEEGKWHFLDRLGDTYRWKSENVSTAEVALALGGFPGVLEANVYGVVVPGHEGRAGCAAVLLEKTDVEGFDWKGLAEFLRGKLPRYAVPVFIRVVGTQGSFTTHNNKQNKVPLREEGVDPARKGSKVVNGREDVFYWLASADKGGYVRFGPGEWTGLVEGRARL
ncbi:hypothetical protein MMC25_002405 [Agyrium rufum]|nr:hypothetical protein [Agyrium rufum]